MSKLRTTVSYWLILSFTFFLSSFANANDTNVLGKNNINIDRLAIQKAIDHARPGDTLYLIGTFQLDGQIIYVNKSNINIIGQGASSHWKTVINGMTQSGAAIPQTPQPDNATYDPTGSYPTSWNSSGNWAFFVGSAPGAKNVSISNVTIKGIKFVSLYVGVQVSPGFPLSTNGLCSGISPSNAKASHISVTDNWFDYNTIAFRLGGSADDISFSGNLVTNSVNPINAFHFNSIMIGSSVECFTDFAGDTSTFPLGDISNLRFENNTFLSDFMATLSDSAIFRDVKGAKIANNYLTDRSGGNCILMEGMTNSVIVGNTCDGTANQISNTFPAGGIYATDLTTLQPPIIRSSNNVIQFNRFNSTYPGIVIDADTTGYTLHNNQFNGTIYGYGGYPNIGDILLCDNGSAPTGGFCDVAIDSDPAISTANHIKIQQSTCTKVVDLGYKNSLSGLLNIIYNISEPFSSVCSRT